MRNNVLVSATCAVVPLDLSYCLLSGPVEYYQLALLITNGIKSTDYLNGLSENALIQSDYSSSGGRLTVDCLFLIKECWNLSTSLFS